MFFAVYVLLNRKGKKIMKRFLLAGLILSVLVFYFAPQIYNFRCSVVASKNRVLDKLYGIN